MATYYDLVMRCPFDTKGIAVQWYHADCGGKIRIGDDAYLKCISCGCSYHLRYWRYRCHESESDYRPTTAAQFASAIAMAGQVTSIAGKKWLMTLLENMGDDW